MVGSAAALTLVGAAFFAYPSSVTFESQESKTGKEGPVFNEIRFFPGWSEDVWMMRQSHGGLALPRSKWDRLAIVVDKLSGTARFYQVEPGELQLTGREKKIEYRASCFVCHSNGPRAVRPRWGSPEVAVSFVDRMKVTLWNLRIKTYGRIEGTGVALGKTPFRLPGRREDEVLTVATCTKCHNSQWWGRGHLMRHQSATIQFMVEKGHMPPPGFALSAQELAQVREFVMGF